MWHWSVLHCTHQYRNGDMHTSACFKIVNKCKISKNLQDLNSRTFQGFSSTFKHLICFQALSRISQARYEPCIIIISLIMPHHMHRVQRCGLLLPVLRGLCLLDVITSCAKMAELIQMPFDIWLGWTQKKCVHIRCRPRSPRERGNFWGRSPCHAAFHQNS